MRINRQPLLVRSSTGICFSAEQIPQGAPIILMTEMRARPMSHIAIPYRIAATGRTATVDRRAYVLQLVEQVLRTVRGERANRPDFGASLNQMVFLRRRTRSSPPRSS